MSELKSVTDVMISLAERIRESSVVKDISTRFGGRGALVSVGSYASGVLNETDAPFVWLYPDATTVDANFGEVSDYAVKVVLGLCPQKDVPSTKDALQTLSGAVLQADVASSAIANAKDACYAAADCGTASQAQALKDAYDAALLAAETALASAQTNLAAANTAAEQADVETCLTKIVAALGSNGVSGIIAKCATAAEKLTTAAGYAAGAGETAKAEAATAAAENINVDKTALSTEYTAANDARQALQTAYDAFVDDPYIKEVVAERTASSNGMVIYGATRIFDSFRREICDIVSANDFGLVVTGFDFRNNSASHFPLDWTEITVKFSELKSL